MLKCINGRMKKVSYATCKMCDEGLEETVQHLVLYYKRYEREKGDMLDIVDNYE